MAGYIGNKSQTLVDGYTQAAADAEFVNDPNSVITVDASGNVGIGTSSPSQKLDVVGNAQIGYTNSIDTYQGLIIGNAKDSSSVSTTSFIDLRNNLGTPDSHIFGEHYTNGSSSLVFGTTPAGSRSTDRRQERLRIHADGFVIAPYGITLGTSAGVYNANNTLDDYEEGTWTPELKYDIVAQSGYTFRYGKYTKVGNLVTAYCSIKLSANASGSGLARIYGLPYTVISWENGANTNPWGGGGSATCDGLTGVTGTLGVWMDASNTAIIPHTFENNSGSFLNGSNFLSGTHVTFMVQYYTAS